MLSPLASLLLLGARIASSQLLTLMGPDWNATEWAWQSSVVVDNSLFVNGGEFFNQVSPPEPEVQPYEEYGTVWIDLSSSWTNASLSNYVWTVPPNLPQGWYTNFWHDPVDDQIYAWGGWLVNSSHQSSLFSMTQFANDTVSWTIAPSPDENGLSINATAPFGCASASSNTTFYCLGGANVGNNAVYPYTHPTFLPMQGLVQYDFRNQTWSNISTPGTASATYIIGARAAHASNFGDSGFLVFIGGSEPADQTFVYGGDVPLVSMAIITLFDIASSTWYTQEATGEIPPGRIDFCSVAAESQNHSFEIFVYGGATNTTYDLSHPGDEGFLNTYALSIPAFRWFKSNDSTPVRRAAHTCQRIGNRQMLSVGGVQPSSKVQRGQALDPWTNSIGVFDMTAFKWSSFYDADASVYQQPDVVRQYYSSSYQSPTWSDPALAQVFGKFLKAEGTVVLLSLT
ncbi:hypothetical protein CLAIMM_05576 [Cladophialophora immunda]|nr:hypothetical protein CLAIMM_05576 [Cladophialophora immunda]